MLFSPLDTSQLSYLRIVDSASALFLGAIFRQKSHQEKAQKCEKSGTRQTKRTLCYSTKAETRRHHVTLFNFGWEHGQMRFFATLHICTRLLLLLIQGLQINLSRQVNLQTESVNNEDQLCIFFKFWYGKKGYTGIDIHT